MGVSCNVIFLNSKGYGDEIAPETRDLLNLVENESVETEFGKELEGELKVQKINPDAKEGYMAFLNAVLDEVIVAKAEGRAEGKIEGKAESAVDMIKDSMPVRMIMKYTQLPLEKIQELATSIGVAVVM